MARRQREGYVRAKPWQRADLFWESPPAIDLPLRPLDGATALIYPKLKDNLVSLPPLPFAVEMIPIPIMAHAIPGNQPCSQQEAAPQEQKQDVAMLPQSTPLRRCR